MVIAVVPTLAIAFQIGSKIFSFTHWPTFFSASLMPLKTPRIMFLPGSSIVFAGLAIPNIDLNQSTNGFQILFLIHVPTPEIASVIPLHIPSHMLLPQPIKSSSQFSLPVNAVINGLTMLSHNTIANSAMLLTVLVTPFHMAFHTFSPHFVKSSSQFSFPVNATMNGLTMLFHTHSPILLNP